MLALIGLGLWDVKDISVRGFEAVKAADLVYLETYTSIGATKEQLETFFAKKMLLADRKLVEQDAEELLKHAKTRNVVLLVHGDPLLATTHVDLLQRAKQHNIPTEVFQNASVLNAVARTGLQAYKFGKTASIPFSQENYQPETPYTVLQENHSIGAHTLFLLDLRPEENKFMTIPEAIRELQRIEVRQGKGLVKDSTLCVGCARLGSSDQKIRAGTAKELIHADFGKPPHCLIIPGKLHFVEEEFVKEFMK